MVAAQREVDLLWAVELIDCKVGSCLKGCVTGRIVVVNIVEYVCGMVVD